MALLIATSFIAMVREVVATRWWGFVFAFLFFFCGAWMFVSEEDDKRMGLGGFVFAMIPPIGYAMSSGQSNQNFASLITLLYAFGFCFVALVWGSKCFLDWFDPPERNSS
jgi:hypothetical protein